VAVPLYSAGTGGFLGEAVADGARLLLGGAAYGSPILLIAGGLVAVSKISVAATVRIAAGGLAGFSGVSLVARASAGPDNAALWSGPHLKDAGGVLGESLWSLCHAGFGSFGPYVIAVLLFLGAALLLTGAELASVGRSAGRGLSRAIAVPAQRRAERRAQRALALADAPASVVRAAQDQEWERSLDARERSLAAQERAAVHEDSYAMATSGGGTGTGKTRRRRVVPDMAPDQDLSQPSGAPRTWTSRGEKPRTWTSAGDPSQTSASSAHLAPPEMPGVTPTVRRTTRQAQLIDGAEHFPDLYGQDGPIWIGPRDDGQEPIQRPTGKFPDPLEDFESELTAAREEDGTAEPMSADDELSDDAVQLSAERNGEFADTPVAAEDEPYEEPAPVVDLSIYGADDDDDDRDADLAIDDAAGAGASKEGPVGVGPQALTPMGRYRAEVTESPEFPWKIPPRRLLTRSAKEAPGPSRLDQQQTTELLLEALGHFGVKAEIVGCVAGPHITRYELRLAPGVKMNKVANLKDDLAYALAATDIRILAPIPGKTAVGVEVPNRNRSLVRLGDVFGDAPPKSSPLNVWLGKDVEGESIFVDLAKMPHLLVAGTTGAGKSACINGMLTSILLSASPADVRMVLVDPKQVELTPYASIPHLLTPVITSPKMAATALQNLVREMEARYSTMALSRTRGIVELNRVRRERGETEFPYILCVIDELADLMMVAPGEVEDSIIRIAQKARAVGIHLVLATQTPRVDVITGMIKANVPSRIAFAVSSQTDSRVILDQNGAESLLGQGDMLFSPVGSARLLRIQGAFIDDEQIESVTSYWRKQGEPDFDDELLEEVVEAPVDEQKGDGLDPDEDPMLEEAIRLVVEMGTASTSMMQRRLRVGYTRAGRLVDMLERRGVISGYEGSKARQVLIGPSEVERIVAQVRAKNGGTPTLFEGDEPTPPPVDLGMPQDDSFEGPVATGELSEVPSGGVKDASPRIDEPDPSMDRTPADR
jgi:S-DNA-T family DNA segregation ATPase FtsK/SpoIIIE